MKRLNPYKRFNNMAPFNQNEQIYTCFSLIFLGSLMFKGNKLLALHFLTKIRKDLKFKEQFDPTFILLISLMKLRPKLLLVLKRKGRSKKLVPTFMSLKKGVTFAIKWSSRLYTKKKIFSTSSISKTLGQAFRNKGPSLKKKLLFFKFFSFC